MSDVRLIDANVLPNYKCQVTATIGDRKSPAEMRFVFWQDIEKAPTIDAVPVVHGRWIWHEDKWEHECPNCHCGFDYDKTYLLFDHGYEYARYCPNCGAKMDGGAEG